MPTPLARLIETIFPQRDLRIREHECREREIDSMLGEVGSVLGRVPFELHRSIQVYIREVLDAS